MNDIKKLKEVLAKSKEKTLSIFHLELEPTNFSCAFFSISDFPIDSILLDKKITTNYSWYTSGEIEIRKAWETYSLDERMKIALEAFFKTIYSGESNRRTKVNTLIFALNTNQCIMKEILESIKIYPVDVTPSYHNGFPVYLYIIHPQELDYDLILEVLKDVK